jgi:predicted MFS family arabinose efflux permease
MTDAQQVATPRRSRTGLVLLIVGALLVIGGVVGGLVAKASADRAAKATGPHSLTVGSYGGFNFRFTHTSQLDYTGLWIGVAVAAVGLVVLVIGIILTARKRRVA